MVTRRNDNTKHSIPDFAYFGNTKTTCAVDAGGFCLVLRTWLRKKRVWLLKVVSSNQKTPRRNQTGGEMLTGTKEA